MLSLLLKWIKKEEFKYLISVACLIEIWPLLKLTFLLIYSGASKFDLGLTFF